MERNIFEAAANKAKKSSQKIDAIGNRSNSLPKQESDYKSYGIEDPEVSEMLSRMREMQRDLEEQLNLVRKKGEEKNFDIDKYLENTQHFGPAEIEKCIRDQTEFENKVNSLFPPEACLQKLKKSKEKLTQERKNKSLGSRKKWIPMR